MTRPDTYDFNEHFDPLPVLYQGQAPTCWWHAWATYLVAQRRIWEGKDVNYLPPSDGGTLSYSEPDAISYLWHTPDGDMLIDDVSGASSTYWEQHGMNWPVGQPPPLPPDDVIKDILWSNAIVRVSVAAGTPEFNQWWYHPDQTTIPTVDLGANPQADSEPHAAVLVGYATDERYLLQNSWGLPYGCQGRVYVTRRYLDYYGSFVEVDSYGQGRADSVVMPPVRPLPPPQPVPPAPTHPGEDMKIIRHADGKAAYAVAGGALIWIPSTPVLFAQGYTVDDVKVEAEDSPLWKLPILGTRPTVR